MSFDKMERFIARIRRACKLKTVKEETDTTSRGGDENSAPDVNRGADVSDSGEESPSLSCGPYIPISECVTGKPMWSHKTMGQTYCNTTSFPFPPEVNWSTYPKKEFSPSDNRPAGTAPPRPPKKSPSVNSVVVNGVGLVSTKMPENVQDAEDSSSTSSSLHSPPGSAGVLYSNVPDMSPLNKSPTEISGQPVSQSLPSSGDPNVLSPVSPPKVDRNLKPDLRRPAESPSYNSSQQSPGNRTFTPYPSGTKTLPTRNTSRVLQSPGSVNKKATSPFFNLGPTPVQKRTQQGNNLSKTSSPNPNSASTLPSSRKRLTGPAHISPHDKVPHVYPEKDANQELTYLVIDCANSEGESKSSAVKNHTHRRSPSAISSSDSSSVEYRLIDHVKTQALIDAMQDREQQLRTNHTNKHIK